MQTNVLLIGCGRMGAAFLRGWQAGANVLKQLNIYLLDPISPLLEGVTRLEKPEDIAKLPAQLDILLAVKPAALSGLLPQLRPHVGPDRLFISIIAGADIDCLCAGLGHGARVIRAMPNTAVEVGKGVSAALPGPMVSDVQKTRCEMLLGSVGELLWLPDEEQLDAVTAVSGSGPAYFFQFAEYLAIAGVQQGLPLDTAMRLARATLVGAGVLADNGDDLLSTLRERVTSPGGTTAAALNCLNVRCRLERVVTDAVAAAAERSRELRQMT